jgi:hypothetical protein
MVDFRKHMTPEQLAKHDRDEAYRAKERERHRSMSNAELAKQAQHCVNNSEGPRKYPDDVPVYDNVVWHFVLPELIARLGAFSVPDEARERLQNALDFLKHTEAKPQEGPYYLHEVLAGVEPIVINLLEAALKPK